MLFGKFGDKQSLRFRHEKMSGFRVQLWKHHVDPSKYQTDRIWQGKFDKIARFRVVLINRFKAFPGPDLFVEYHHRQSSTSPNQYNNCIPCRMNYWSKTDTKPKTQSPSTVLPNVPRLMVVWVESERLNNNSTEFWRWQLDSFSRAMHSVVFKRCGKWSVNQDKMAREEGIRYSPLYMTFSSSLQFTMMTSNV